MAELSQMNSDLMRAASLQPARQNTVAIQPFLDLNVSYRHFAESWYLGAAAARVAPIPDEIAQNALRDRVARHNGEIPANYTVGAKLSPESLLGQWRSGEYN
jgi:hypothetical protein